MMFTLRYGAIFVGRHPGPGWQETVEHVLIQCGQYERERERQISCMGEKGIQEISLKSILSRTSLDIVSNIC